MMDCVRTDLVECKSMCRDWQGRPGVAARVMLGVFSRVVAGRWRAGFCMSLTPVACVSVTSAILDGSFSSGHLV